MDRPGAATLGAIGRARIRGDGRHVATPARERRSAPRRPGRPTAAMLAERDTGVAGDVSAETLILRAAIAVMAEHGYHGTSVRDIAERADLSPASLYNHFASKQGILVAIMERGIDELLRRTTAALEHAPDDPTSRLRAIVAVHVLYHLEDRRGTLLGTSELRALEEPARTTHVAKRRRHQRVFEDVVAEGVRRGVFTTPYPDEAARAIVTMCTAVASWYRPDGPLTPAEITERYQALALSAAGART